MKTLKLIVKILIGISSLIYLLFALMGFATFSWQTGIFWLIGTLLLTLLFLSLTKIIFPKLPTAGKIVLAIVPFFLFITGGFFYSSFRKGLQ
ncbi:MAG: hypothetical protein KL787_03395 [Taibaiella sp.]|nr:hypothetical protein [Taibaiella sp.]